MSVLFVKIDNDNPPPRNKGCIASFLISHALQHSTHQHERNLSQQENELRAY